MYSWGDDTDDWAKPGTYKFDAKTAATRAEAKKAEDATGPRTYNKGSGPNEQMISPKKRIQSSSKNVLVVAVDVTGSMASWPFEIFDRLPLLYQTLSQYREDLEIAFVAIGDAGCDRWPLQTTDFSQGFSLDATLKALFGEGGGGDAPESYGLYAWWANRRIDIPVADAHAAATNEKPFLIVFGDAPMHPTVPLKQLQKVLGEADDVKAEGDSIEEWQRLQARWNVWFLRRPTGTTNDATEVQWRAAVGRNFLHLHDESRAIDYAMGIIAHFWGKTEDLKANMLARQDEHKVKQVMDQVDGLFK
jgi:hypothetical protein